MVLPGRRFDCLNCLLLVSAWAEVSDVRDITIRAHEAKASYSGKTLSTLVVLVSLVPKSFVISRLDRAGT